MPRGGGVTMTPPDGGAVIRYRERLRPLMSVAAILDERATDKSFRVTSVRAVEPLVTSEGEYAAIVDVGVAAPMTPFLVMPLVFAGMLPSKIAIGVDGVLVRWLWQKKFIPMSQIARIERADDRTVVLHLVDGSEELIYTSMRRRSGFGSSWAVQHRDAVLARIGEAIMAYRARGPAADISALVGKGTRTRSEWLGALGKLRGAEGGYRDAVVRDDDLWRVVEDPSAPEDARGGAALLLRRSLDEAGKARVRVAAEATASPKLRVALDAAASDTADEAMHAALEELAGEDHEVTRRASA